MPEYRCNRKQQKVPICENKEDFMKRPVIAIPMGDPAGIGPEIILKALSSEKIENISRCIVIGDKNVIENAMGFQGIPSMEIHEISLPEEADYSPGVLNLVNLANVDMCNFQIGEINGMCGQAAYQYIEKSINFAKSGLVDAVATPPINKESLKAGGVDFIGHTEIFGSLTETEDPLTMFEVRGMRVFFLSRHVSLRDACDLITKERIIDYVKRCKTALSQLGVTKGCMAIAGLNPHSGEHGLFGNEEVDFIFPAVHELIAQGFDVAGPVGADSVFYQALSGKYNSVLSLYHDQGHIATKTLDFEKTISLTLGMPILRTSVDHGTAMDIAGKGIASSVSMEEAIRLAVKYAPSVKKHSAGSC